MRYFTVLIMVLFSSVQLFAQSFPTENSSLNYRLVGFSYPEKSKECRYHIEIAEGNLTDKTAFDKAKIIDTVTTNNRLIIELPYFGKSYTWRVVSRAGNAKPEYSPFYHFYVSQVPAVDTELVRLRILKQADAYKNSFVFFDGNRVLYDMSGKPIWFLPVINEVNNEDAVLRDLKISGHGTITFLLGSAAGQQIYEIDYNGKILWKGPDDGRVSGGKQEQYHHEFTRLQNGNYMVLGNENFAKGKNRFPHEGKRIMPADTPREMPPLPFGTIIEYDKNGQIVWSWKSSAYFNSIPKGMQKNNRDRPDIDVHENSFYFDERSKNIYVSFKNISQVIKVSYTDKKVVGVYGAVPGNNFGYLFCGQHGLKYSPNGYFYLFDNNVCEVGNMPKVVLLKEQGKQSGKLYKVWEYSCNLEGMNTDTGKKYLFPSGGNVMELPDKSMFVAMSCNFSKAFIVNRSKQIVWSAVPEKKNTDTNKWEVIPQYRASIITDTALLHKLIWNNDQ